MRDEGTVVTDTAESGCEARNKAKKALQQERKQKDSRELENVGHVITTMKVPERANWWPADFDKSGDIRKNRFAEVKGETREGVL